MCQLTAVNLGEKQRNSLFLYALQNIGSDSHGHGTGIMQGNSGYRTELKTNTISNLGEIYNEFIKGNSLVCGHVRLASTGVPICEENSHPFETDRILLMHNGTLKFKDKVRAEKHERRIETTNSYGTKITSTEKDSDSLLFAEELEKELAKGKSFIDALKDAMNLFYGKFAFIIRDKEEKKTYIIRGKTAKLHIAYLVEEDVTVKNRYIIQTEEETLKKAILVSKNILSLSSGKNIKFTKPELLDEETIFLVTPSGIKVAGKIEENSEPVVAKEVSASSYQSNRGKSSGYVPYTKKAEMDEHKAAEKISKFMVANAFSPKDIEIMFLRFLGIPLLEADLETMIAFIDNIIPLLSTTKKLKKLISKNNLVVTMWKYTDLKISQYPWTLCEPQEQYNVIKTIIKENNTRK